MDTQEIIKDLEVIVQELSLNDCEEQSWAIDQIVEELKCIGE